MLCFGEALFKESVTRVTGGGREGGEGRDQIPRRGAAGALKAAAAADAAAETAAETCKNIQEYAHACSVPPVARTMPPALVAAHGRVSHWRGGGGSRPCDTCHTCIF